MTSALIRLARDTARGALEIAESSGALPDLLSALLLALAALHTGPTWLTATGAALYAAFTLFDLAFALTTRHRARQMRRNHPTPAPTPGIPPEYGG